MILTANFTGVPTPSITWTHGDTVLTTTNGVTVDTKEKSSTLTVKGLEGTNSGTYTVKAENIIGSDSLDFTVNVKGETVERDRNFNYCCSVIIMFFLFSSQYCKV